jgi:hypothetical protein
MVMLMKEGLTVTIGLAFLQIATIIPDASISLGVEPVLISLKFEVMDILFVVFRMTMN